MSELKASKKWWLVLIIAAISFLALDLCFSFYQFYLFPLDGDFAGGIVPAGDVKPLLKDPFGFGLLFSGEGHANPNRYFSHLLFYHYFRILPGFFQLFFDPVTSLYLSVALMKGLVHIGFLISIPLIIKEINKKIPILFSLVGVTAFLQTCGYGNYIQLVDKSISYLFFYGLPLMVLGFFVWFWIRVNKKTGWTLFTYTKLGGFLLFLAFSGPLTAPLMALFLLFWMGYQHRRGFLKQRHFILSGVVFLVCAYSFFLGKFNTVFFQENISVLERYQRIPLGLWNTLTGKPWWLFYALPFVLFRLIFSEKWKAFKWDIFWFVLAAIALYLLLLPLGGYRPYRPLILRFDTFAPVYFCLIIGFISLTGSMLVELENQRKQIIAGSIMLVFILVFTNADRFPKRDNSVEKEQLYSIMNSGCLDCKVDAEQFFNWPGIPKTDFELDQKSLILLGISNKELKISGKR